MIQRIALGLEYDGSRYHGWQIQPNKNTVQGQLHRALSKIANSPIHVTCAGRTDVGVHAKGQVIHFDTEVDRTEDAWLRGTNSILPDDIAVQWVKKVDETFHARYSAIGRTYEYVIYNAPVRSALYARNTSFYYHPLNIARMQQGAQYLLGTHDFTALRDAQCQSKTPVRTITELNITQSGPFITLRVSANAFLHHMIRNIVGLLLPIGEGKQEPEWAEAVLSSRDRRKSGVTALPNGLTLVEVHYPAD